MLKEDIRREYDVFICYADRNKNAANSICTTLEDNQIKCWIAPRDIFPGMDYGDAIVEAINKCKILVVVFSAEANASEHVKNEIERAVSKRKLIIPIRIEDTVPYGSLALHLSRRQWFDATRPPLKKHLKNLADNIKSILTSPGKTLETKIVEEGLPPGEKTVISHYKKFLVPLVSLAILAFAAITLWLYMVKTSSDATDLADIDDEIKEIVEVDNGTAIDETVEMKEIKQKEPIQFFEETPILHVVAEEPATKSMTHTLSAELQAGIDAFIIESYEQCIKYMQEVLHTDPDNEYALYYKSEARRKIESNIQSIFESAQESFEKGYYEQSIAHLEEVLQLDAGHEASNSYLIKARMLLAQEQIALIVHFYIKSLEDNTLLDFYAKNCSPGLYEEIKNDVRMMVNLYTNLQATVTDRLSIHFTEAERAVVVFLCMISGIAKDEGQQQVLFEGQQEWVVIMDGENWRIREIEFKPYY